ncbi:hypothetical protein Ancab_014171 [Ancistrocladus abbreviatus]
MASSSAFLKLACVVFVCMTVAAPLAEAAVTCGTVTQSLAPCISYLRGAGKAPTSGCCGGVKTLNGMARSPADRQAACNCLKNAAASMSGSLSLKNAAALPGQCGVSIPYSISPTTDCSKVQ